MFAVGTFADATRTFAGLVVEEERVLPLPGTVAELVADWDRALERLAALADDGDGDWRALADLHVLPPVRPVHVLQSGANYRNHVLELIVAEERQRGDLDDAQARAMGERIMDARAATGEPYVFLGSPAALSGAHDDVVLPAEGEQHDWELELAAVLTADAQVAGFLIVNDVTTRDLVYRPDLKAIGTDWLRSKNAPTFLPAGPWIVPAQFVADPMDLQITLRLNGGHDLRPGAARRLRRGARRGAAGGPAPDRLTGRQRDAPPALPAGRRRHGERDHRAGSPAQPLHPLREEGRGCASPPTSTRDSATSGWWRATPSARCPTAPT
jgi:2-keto-4-pentenoate hydratase/2-oxohepta-3-ene-1,7-dioic acid hydratase in catechol pathway